MNGTEPTAPIVGPLTRQDLLYLAWMCDYEGSRLLISVAEIDKWRTLAKKLRYLIEQTTPHENVQ